MLTVTRILTNTPPLGFPVAGLPDLARVAIAAAEKRSRSGGC